MNAEVIVTENELPADVIDAIRGGRKIEAIRLANAKVLVDRAWRTHGPQKPIPSFADQPRGLGNLIKSLGLAIVAMAAWYFYSGS